MTPYTIKKNDLFGRYLVASKDLKEGELILKEEPMMVGPQINAFLSCFRCSATLGIESVTPCQECGVAIVCRNCEGLKHPEGECNLLKLTKLNYKDLMRNPQIIMPLRCLLLRAYDEMKWEELIKLEAHMDLRRDTYIWRVHKHGVENVLAELQLITKDDVASEIVQKVCGILDVNAFELRPALVNGFVDPNKCLRGLYVTAAIMAHDCTPNIYLSVDEKHNMTIHACRAIAKDELIYINYTHGLQGTEERRKHLKEGKYFDCVCKRCSDSTELGTNVSALVCPTCKTGYVNCTEPLKGSYKVPWKCTQCNYEYNGNMVKTTIDLCNEKIHGYKDVKEADDALEKLKLTLSPNHYIILELKQNLVSMRDITTERKITLCKELLEVIQILEPGLSRHIGITQYEYHNALVDLANKKYNSKEIKTQEFLRYLKEAEALLVSSIKSLLYEPKLSPEGRLAQRALTDLRVLRHTISDLGHILLLQTQGEKNGNKKTNDRKQKRRNK